jgi:polyhydroxybutyrate depolymerase
MTATLARRVMSLRCTWFACFLLVLQGCGGGSSGNSGTTSPQPAGISAPSGLSYSSAAQFIAGQPITELAPTVTGTVTGYSASPALPSGLVLDSMNGHITGVPQQSVAQSTYTITASNSAGATSFPLVIAIIDADSFWVEPKQSSTIGIDQLIQVYAALQKSSESYPQYPDTASLTFESSDPSVASVDTEGHVLGVHEGTSVVSVSDGIHTSQVSITVAGSMIRRTVTVAGQGDRDYWIYTPSFSSASPHPAIVSMHGAGGSAMLQASMTQLNALGASQGIYIVYLDGTGLIPTFNAGGCCGFAQTQNIDDVLYVSRVLDDVSANYSIDATKTFASGFSNGAMMSHRLACALSDRFAGIAAVSGGSAEFDKDGTQYFVCNPQRPIPILHIHALNDRNYPYAGGAGEGISNYNFYSVDSTIHDWVVRNNVTDAATIEHASATTTCYHHDTPADASKPSAPVVLCKLDPPDVFDSVNGIVFGGGHSWPGGVKSPSTNSDVPNADFDASSYIWNFLNR